MLKHVEKLKSQVGRIYTTMKISDMERTRVAEVQALAGTCAALTVIPQELELMDRVRLGVVTLETLALSLDRLTGKLKEEMLLLLLNLSLERSTSGESLRAFSCQ